MIDDRDARAREVEQLRTERDELERSRIDVEAQFHEARAAWEEQRQAQEARFAAECQDWRRRTDEQERRIDELAQRLRAAEELQARACDRAARAAAESERNEARARWEAERRELKAAAERQLRALRGDAERRFAELQAQAERQRQELRAELERKLVKQQAESERELAALRRGCEAERHRWLALLAAARPEPLADGPAPGDSSPDPVDRPGTAGRPKGREGGAIESIAADSRRPRPPAGELLQRSGDIPDPTGGVARGGPEMSPRDGCGPRPIRQPPVGRLVGVRDPDGLRGDRTPGSAQATRPEDPLERPAARCEYA